MEDGKGKGLYEGNKEGTPSRDLGEEEAMGATAEGEMVEEPPQMESNEIPDEDGEGDDSEMEEVRRQFLDSMSIELEADFELSAEITKKGILAKVFGRRSLSRNRVKEVLGGIWRLKGNWKLKTLNARDGIWGIFFDNEEDKAFILKQRPWLVNGALLNIRNWPSNGEWQGDNDSSLVAEQGTKLQVNVRKQTNSKGDGGSAGKVQKQKKVAEKQCLDGCSYLRKEKSAQQVISCNEITLASNGPSLSGQKKRKATDWVIPIVKSSTHEGSESTLPCLEVANYSAGSKVGESSSSTSKFRPGKRKCGSLGRRKSTGRGHNQAFGDLRIQTKRCSLNWRGWWLAIVASLGCNALRRNTVEANPSGVLSPVEVTPLNSAIFKSNKVDIMQARFKMLQRMDDLLSAQRNASWKEGKAGIAVGCQDRQSGKWLWSAKRIEAASAMEAEASAIFWALQLSRECGFRSIAIASDALLLVQALIMRRLPPCWKTRTMATKIWSLLEDFQKFRQFLTLDAKMPCLMKGRIVV
ncbi:hypothetical protein F8388_005538 [Cannabis sativa]|uniref:DUF4283 domain-containing protein n=1 Tax=Cannabis sativa TaxID=3483 RepID=A0A7J6G6N1_CANSA|nr:hypothetical protein G4B88_023134 [Cannabis sativa]KAF4387921.1 hypothetical protein F8388_005538 [Cannabis sativa]